MKKLFLVGAFALFGAMNAHTGNVKVGAHLGITTGDFDPLYGLNAGVDLGYSWKLPSNFEVGLATGYSNYFPKSDFKDIGGKSMGVIPIAASGQYNFDGGFFLGTDLGYGVLLYDGDSDGGFYYQPKAGYRMNNVDLVLSYKGVSKDGSSLSSVNFGVAFNVGK